MLMENWNARLYNEKYNFVYAFGESLIDLLDPQPDERILDSLNKFCSNQADECGGKFDGWETRLELPKGAGLKEGPWTR